MDDGVTEGKDDERGNFQVLPLGDSSQMLRNRDLKTRTLSMEETISIAGASDKSSVTVPSLYSQLTIPLLHTPVNLVTLESWNVVLVMPTT